MKKAAHEEIVTKQGSTVSTVTPPAIRTLRVFTTPSLSGNATLTYLTGCSAEGEIYIRVSANSGGGFWSAEWVAFTAIQSALTSLPKDTPITSYALRGLFSGKSVNSRGFLMATLKHLGLVQPMPDKQRCYVLLDARPFLAEVKTLIDSGVALPAAEPSKHAAEGKKSVPKEKAKSACPS